jgi:hypothetical protein
MESFYTNAMDITVTKQESIFNGLVLKEKVDEEVLHKLIHSDLLKEVLNSFNGKSYANEKEQLMSYRRLIKDGYAHVLYSKTSIGRCSSNNGLSYLSLRRNVRHSLAKDCMVDIDIDNCHPVLMVQMLDRHGFNCHYLKDYIQGRERWFAIVKECWYVESYVPADQVRDCCKTLFLRLMYGGSYKAWVNDWKLPTKAELPKELSEFIAETSSIIDLFVEMNPALLAEATKKSKDGVNIRGSVCSTVMQEKECLVLEVIYRYLFRRLRSDIMSLCADGIMLDKDLYYPELLTELRVEVFCKTGFSIHLSQKEMDHAFENIDEHIVNPVPFVPNSDFRAVDEIVYRMQTVWDDFKESSYYAESMTVVKMKSNRVVLRCSSKKCKLCKVKHEASQCHLKISDKKDFVFCCHGSQKIFKKSVKGNALIRSVQMEGIDSSIREFFNMNLAGVDHVLREQSLFLGCDESGEVVVKPEYFSKYLVLDASCGKGKTTFMKKLLHRREAKRILFVSQRKTFTNFICDEFKSWGIVNYLDIYKTKGSYDCDRLCIQVESLHKIRNTKYDVVILDEVETILNQFSSSTMINVQECWFVLQECCKSSSWVMLADAFITNRTLDFCTSMKQETEKLTLLINDRPFLQGRKCIQVSQDSMNEQMMGDLDNGKRVVYISTCRSDLTELGHIVKAKCPDKSVRLYDKDSSKDDLKNVNQVWNSCDLIGFTPVIQTGISYMNTAFDLCYANLKSSNLSRDAMQMMMRCRMLNDETVYFSINKRQIYNVSNIEMFASFSAFDSDRMARTRMMINALSDKCGNKNKELIDMLRKCMETTDPTLLKIMWYNLREHMLSQCHYNSMCLYLLRKQGYEVIMLGEEDHNKDKKADPTDLNYIGEYLNIETIESDVVYELSNKELAKEERLSVDKFYFEKLTVGELPNAIKSKLFFDYYQNTHKKAYLTHVKYEKSDLSAEQLIRADFAKSDYLVSKMKLDGRKVQVIKTLNKKLGLDHSCKGSVVVDKRLITGLVLDYLRKNVAEFAVLYKSKIKLTGDKRNDNFCALKLLQKIYKDWSGLVFKKHSSDVKGNADSYITDCFDYYNYILPFSAGKPDQYFVDLMSSNDFDD